MMKIVLSLPHQKNNIRIYKSKNKMVIKLKTYFIYQPIIFCFLVSAFIANINILVSLIISLRITSILFFIKLLLEAIVLYIGSKLFLTKFSILSYFCWNLTQPLYILLVGIGGLIGKFSWKK